MTDPASPHPSDQPAPSLHVDSDWKAQAEAERARLAEKEAALNARSGAGGPDQLPPAEFRSLVGMLASQAVMGLGTMADQQGRVVVDLEGSRFAIDLLQVLADKTKGNLTAEEQGELDEVVRELNMRFAAITRAVADHMSRGMPGGAAPAGVSLAPAPAAAPKPASATGASKLIIP